MDDAREAPATDGSGAFAFEDFFVRTEPRLRAALTSRYGAELGREATAEALAWSFEHWDRVARMEHPIAYLYRVGQSRTRRLRRRASPGFACDTSTPMPEVDPRVAVALRALPERQRVAVLLVHGHDWSHADVAALLGIRASTVSTHVARALAQLRRTLEVHADE
jgi:DNA-directed RNA polymerase specialized sigma24 family protein